MAQASAKGQVVVKYGPYGSQMPESFSMVIEDCETIKEVIIRHGWIVDAIGFKMVKPNRDTTTKMFNENFGHYESKIVLKSGEYITQISGTYGNFLQLQGKDRAIATLKIHTNLCPAGYGPYGLGKEVTNVCNFSSPVPPPGRIVGFFGRHNQYFESIGIFAKTDCAC
ncbi:hypothetical protein SOVF_145160 [Spinacia oleracea]|uniref:Mannose/glucose-specific lectin n=1 Tax=Spinacia oleracea TaxID=3562 RepID=A0A9R0IPD7_SPIOL|nr:mannose/glucose-specific lectin-like [Spinacia oleracea]KNA10350.1 hypothetical protein SOVF_145160 [Spinacia oleracea]